MKELIGARKTELSVLNGQMYKSDEALAIGLIDVMAADAAQAENEVDSYLKKITSCAG